MKHIKQQNKLVSPSPQKGAITERGLFRLMLPSLLGILLCSTCLAGLTWAYFSDSVTSSANTITAATFTVDVTITEITETGGDPLTTVEADSAGTAATDTTTVSSPGDVSAEQEENTPSGTPLANASNTAANAEGNTLTANVLSVGTIDPSTDTPANEEGGTATGTVTQPGGTTTGEGSPSEEGTSGGGSDPEIKAAGEDTPQVADTLSGQGIENAATDNPITLYLDGSTTVECNNGIYTLMSGKVYTVKTLTPGRTYTVTLKASNTATGYCNISFGGKEYHTVALAPNVTISFTVCASENYTSLTIKPQWGTCNEMEDDEASILIDDDGSIGTPTTGANTTTTEQSASAAAAKTDETLREEIVQSNEQTNNGETAGGTTENTTADTNDETTGGSTVETARTVPGESSKTTGESTDGNEEPANEGTDTEKANSEPSADEPTDPPSEGQSEE